ncbi:YceD family protein [Halovulum sp. GXIMD14794]
MAEDRPQPTTTQGFHRPVRLARLGRATAHEFDETADAGERAAVAELLDLQGISKLRISGKLDAAKDGGWTFRGILGASVTQTCVATLQPVPARIDVPVHRDYVAGLDAGTEDISLDPDAPDELEPLPETLDLGALAIEELALALPPYPRAKDAGAADAEARPEGAAPLEPEPKPFAALAALKQKLSDGEH